MADKKPAEVTIRYDRPAVGYPAVGTVVTVERTEHVEALLRLGIAVEEPSDA